MIELNKIISRTLLMAVMGAGLATAGDEALVISDKNPTACLEDPSWCGIFGRNTLYENENAFLVKEVKVLMRYHGQFHNTTLVHDTTGTSWSDKYWEHRRFRPGVKVTFANDWMFYNEWNIATQTNQSAGVYDDFWENPHTMGIKGPFFGGILDIGKHKAKMTHEWATSSNRILAVERAPITNEVIAFNGHPWGITYTFDAGGIEHEVGGWLAGADDLEADGSGDEHWWDTASRGAFSYRAIYEVNDNSELHFNFMFVNNDDGTVSPTGVGDRLEVSPYNNLFVLSSVNEWDIAQCDRQFGLLVEAIYGGDREQRNGTTVLGDNNAGAGQDTFGFLIQPSYDLTERLQWVGRYGYASFSRLHRPQRRAVERDIRGGQFDNRPNFEDVHSFYTGLNYRLCGDNLKVMVGYEYLTSDVFSNSGADNGELAGDNLMIAIRSYF